MRITYDQRGCIIYTFYRDNRNNKACAEGIAIDYDLEGKIAGIEILDAVKRFGTNNVFKKVTLEDLALHTS